MNFIEAYQQYLSVKASYDQGQIDAATLEESILNLRVLDIHHREWQIAPLSGKWQWWTGMEWVEDTPPGDAFAVTDEPVRGWRVPVTFWTLSALLLMILAGVAFGLFRQVWQDYSNTPVVEEIGFVPLPTSTLFPSTATATPHPDAETPTAVEEEFQATDSISTATPSNTNRPGVIAPTRTYTPSPTLRFVSNEEAEVVRWRRVSYSVFNQASAIQDEWRYLLDIVDPYTFEKYMDLNGVRLKFDFPFVDILSEDPDTYEDQSDIEIEEVLAVPAGSDDVEFEILCRVQDLENNYVLSLTRTEWRLYRYLESEETEYAVGSTPSSFQNGEWAFIRLRCAGNRISAYMNGELLAEAVDSAIPDGAWGVIFYLSETAFTGDAFYYRHQVWLRDPGDETSADDLAETGPLVYRIEHGPVTEGDLSNIGIEIYNRGTSDIEIAASQIYVLDENGEKTAVLPIRPSGVEGEVLEFPLVIEQGSKTGELYFPALDEDGLELVIDLSTSNLDEVRFTLEE